MLGRGHYGTVRLAVSESKGSTVVAVKTIAKSKINKSLKLIHRELELLKELDHPNIVKFYENYQDNEHFHIVMEYCSGGELLDKLLRIGQFDERQVAFQMDKALRAIKYLHERGIVHRDIKPQNFMYSSKTHDAEIKLIDFGLSRHFEPNETLQSQVGTPYFTAPEVLTGSYDCSCDLWSLGVMLYLLLSGTLPFEGDTTAALAKAILTTQPDFSRKEWARITPLAKSLVKDLLEKDPKKRITAEKALEHPWIVSGRRNSFIDPEHTNQIMRNLQNYSAKSKFKKEVLDVLVTILNDKEVKQLREAFNFFDKDGNGEITLAELKEVIKDQGLKITDKELEKIMKNFGLQETDTIGFSEFLAAAMDQKLYQNREVLWAAFSHFDTDKAGYITANNIREAMKRVGRKLTADEINAMIAEVEKRKDDRITFEEFCALMKMEDYTKEIEEETKKVDLVGKEVCVQGKRQNTVFFAKANTLVEMA